jgi:predicted TIM-barrel fold metal-dependent hydrolase
LAQSPHPNVGEHGPNDADLVSLVPLMAPDETLRQKLLVENPASLYDFES